MDIRQLRYFCAVAEVEHISRAAEKLHLAQPALSQQIRALERELDVELLLRVGRGVELTEAGRTLWREAEGILARVEATAVLVREVGRGETGRVTIGLTDTATFAAPVMAVLKAAQDQWPRIRFTFLQSTSSDLYEAVLDRRVDLAFARSPAPDDGNLVSTCFLSETFCVAMLRGHPLARHNAMGLAMLANEPLILPVARNDQRGAELLRVMGATGHDYNVVQRTPEYLTAINLVIAGFGLTIVPSTLASLRTDVLRYIPIKSRPRLITKIVLASRRDERSMTVQNIRSFIDAN